MRFQVHLQDVTTMTAFRRDGHPSVYRKPISVEKSQKPGAGLSSDCSHWCLPGVPDIWNEMLGACSGGTWLGQGGAMAPPNLEKILLKKVYIKLFLFEYMYIYF